MHMLDDVSPTYNFTKNRTKFINIAVPIYADALTALSFFIMVTVPNCIRKQTKLQ